MWSPLISRHSINMNSAFWQESACNAGDMGLIPGSGRSPGEGHGNSLQYSCLENALDRGVWWATALGVAKNQPWLKHLSMHHAEQVHKLWFAKPFYGLWHLIGEVQPGDPLMLTLRFQFSSVAQSCPTLCDSMECRPPGSSVHGISQTRILEWVGMPSSRGFSWPRDQTCIFCVSCIADDTELPGKPCGPVLTHCKL